VWQCYLFDSVTYPSPQLVLEHIGVFVAAITGVLAARGKRVDLFGVLVLALVTSFGGGTVRDVLVGDLPVVWLRGPGFLLNATSATLITFTLVRFRNLPHRALLIADAFALALFTMVGTQKGVSLSFSAPVSVLLGVVTGVAGGMFRDVLTGEVPMVFRPDIYLYATAAMCGSIAYTALFHVGLEGHILTIVGASIVLILRLAGIYWKLALPVFEQKDTLER
jgi:uncharacterized membrane protein YeiH